jgi:hypothetical protein
VHKEAYLSSESRRERLVIEFSEEVRRVLHSFGGVTLGSVRAGSLRSVACPVRPAEARFCRGARCGGKARERVRA